MLYSAFILGLVSSLHCLGMCGPIALALPVPPGGVGAKILGRVLYNGRIVTYSLLGLIMGFFGQNLSLIISQQQMSVIIGLILLAIIIVPSPWMQKFSLFAPSAKLTHRIKSRFSQLFRTKSLFSLFLIGILNGLLPCGMVYVALAGAVALAHSWEGMAYMALFGLGTVPLMLAVSLGSQWLRQSWRTALLKTTPAFTLALALLFVLRGLNLGIPMISPQLETAQEHHSPTAKLNCCHKPE